RGRWQARPHHHIHTRRRDAVLIKGYVESSSRRALRPGLPDVLGNSDHRMPDILASAKRTAGRPQALPNRVLPFPDPFRQSLIDDDHLAFRRVVGSLEAAAGD